VAEGTVAQLLARSGQTDFEACFVQLAFGDAAVVAPPAWGPG
jgi:sodium transport system ATP-binding protein